MRGVVVIRYHRVGLHQVARLAQEDAKPRERVDRSEHHYVQPFHGRPNDPRVERFCLRAGNFLVEICQLGKVLHGSSETALTGDPVDS
ncbi:hypothetical protein GCM10023205_36980 [Yinghuangia aomiensis]|uniref:Transposase n=1 Tax=Yinghuangia aomiensis TaxID=676205 RepID=A0ABP9HDH6_9ACTN